MNSNVDTPFDLSLCERKSLSLKPSVQSFFTELNQKLKSDAENMQSSAVIQSVEQNSELITQAAFTVFASQYVNNTLLHSPTLLLPLLEKSSPLFIEHKLSKSALKEWLESRLETCEDTENFDQTLRKLRKEFMLRTIWRDINRLARMQDTTEELSWFADLAIAATLNFHYQKLCIARGTPRDEQGEAQPMLILGMGKLGAYELNLSSDIDLIFCYPESGETDHEKKPLSNQEFFSLLGKKIIASLDTNSAEGFVFRVDMRLRPYGQSGALVSNFRSLEEYYQTQGREWERYAMVKVRVVASNGAETHSKTLMAMLKSFTYRKYVDFSVIDALRKLKAMINQEVTRRNLQGNIKLGPGGIREVEFIAQVFQLIRGGRDLQLQDNRLKIILPELTQLGCLPEITQQKLWQAYSFLRNTEHALQAWNDEQTQSLPLDEDDKERLAIVMGFECWSEFFKHLENHREYVHAEFQSLIAPVEDKHSDSDSDAVNWNGLWLGSLDEQSSLHILQSHGHEDPERSFALVETLRNSSNVVNLHASGRERLDDFVPLLLHSVSQTSAPSETLARILKLVKAVVRRSAYLLLLVENPPALEQLVKLSVASPLIADQLAEHPALLDELLDQRTLYHPPNKSELEDELRQHMMRIPADDLEAQMEALRYFHSSHGLRVAACEVTSALPLMKVSDYLTWLAEVLLGYILNLAWQEITAKYGTPEGKDIDNPGFVIVGYGKLGGIELGHGSDLDLVFIYDADTNGHTSGNAQGKSQIENVVFYMRLGQKIIHIMNTNTVSGQLYEVDMRLRPSGNSGMLVSSLSAFEKYQSESAWTWEHQALVRARAVAGSTDLTAQFNNIRQRILANTRDLPTLKKDVIEMREKMREHLGSKAKNQGSELFHLKQDPGGIVDIEFMVQYAVLAWAHQQPELARYTDNIRILESLAQSGLLGTQEVHELTEAYKAFRSMGHGLTLQQQTNLIDGKLLAKERQAVRKIWRNLLEDQEP